MTPAEIRALYVETLARHRSGMNGYYWHVIGPTMRAEYCKEVEPDVDALAAAGLLPTTAVVETCVAGRDGECQCPTTVRYVTDPREVSE